MKSKIFIFLSLVIALSSAKAQNDINFSHLYSAGGKLMICVDSSAKNVYYDNIFPNQPHTSFNYLPDVNNISIQAYFRKEESISQFRYTVLVGENPIVVNKPINKAQLTAVERPDEVLSSARLGTFPIKGKIITTLIYNIEKPLDIYKSVFYGKSIPKAKIILFSKVTSRSSYIDVIAPKERTNLTFAKKDLKLTVVKDKSDIDYLYYTSIKDKQTNKIVFESTAWQYGSYSVGHDFLPYINISKNVFKKSGNYEIIIQPFIKWHPSQKNIERYRTRYMLAITLDEENYTKKELVAYTLIIAFIIAIACLVFFYFIKKRTKKSWQKKSSKQTWQSSSSAQSAPS